METDKLQGESFYNKYGNFADFSAELEALHKFQDIEQHSSKSLNKAKIRIAAGAVLILCLTLVFGISSFIMSFRTTEDIKHIYNGPLSVRYFAFSLNVNAHEAYLSMRNLALCDESDVNGIHTYIAQARESVSLMYGDFAVLKSIANNNEALKPQFDELEALLAAWDDLREENMMHALEGDMERCRAGVAGAGTRVIDAMNACIDSIAAQATGIADADYSAILRRSRVFDISLIVLTAVILASGVGIIIAINRHTAKAITLVENAQREQNKILDELMVMDETLRQSLSRMEHESEIAKEVQERYENSLEAANDAIWELNTETHDFFASEKWTDVTGLPLMKRLDRDSALWFVHEEDREKFRDAITDESKQFSVQIRAKQDSSDEDAPPRWLHIRGRRLDDCRLTGSVSDISQSKEAEQFIEYIAYHDVITSLPNRAMFVQSLEKAIKKAKKTGNGGCVLFIDLDNFKLINDGHGHEFGDKILAEVAGRLLKALKKGAMLARFGGDEFLILAENVSGEDELHGHIDAVTNALEEPIALDGGLFFVTASIGVSRFPEDGNDVSQILKNSDAAMYESKFAGRNTYALYNKLMSTKLTRKAAIADILRTAIEKDMIYLVYQPQVRCADGVAVSCEALMRLRDAGLGFMSPAEFIPIAEETRLIVPLGYWAIRKTIETDLALRKNGIVLNHVSVNVSEIQLREHDFAACVKGIIDEYGYDASRLHLEITETILLSDIEAQVAILNKLKDIGIKVELDDFGTGFSSLNYVRTIPLDVIKIDKCFIDEIGVDCEKEELIDLITKLAKMIDAEVVAEGVETAQQVEFFKKKDSRILLQGYYYSKPLAFDEFQGKIEELNRNARA